MTSRFRSFASFLVGGCLVFLPCPAAGQGGTASASGTWWEVAAGAGSGRITCEICDPSRESGWAASLAVGSYANAGLRVGLEGSAWTAEERNGRESVYGAGVVLQLHPRPRSGLHVVGGLGWSGYRAEGNQYDAARLTLGAGWDLPLFGSWTVGNRLVLDAASHFPLRGGEAVVEPAAGLSVLKWHIYLRKS